MDVLSFSEPSRSSRRREGGAEECGQDGLRHLQVATQWPQEERHGGAFEASMHFATRRGPDLLRNGSNVPENGCFGGILADLSMISGDFERDSRARRAPQPLEARARRRALPWWWDPRRDFGTTSETPTAI